MRNRERGVRLPSCKRGMRFQHSLAAFLLLASTGLFSTNYDTVPEIRQPPVSHNPRQSLLFTVLMDSPEFFLPSSTTKLIKWKSYTLGSRAAEQNMPQHLPLQRVVRRAPGILFKNASGEICTEGAACYPVHLIAAWASKHPPAMKERERYRNQQFHDLSGYFSPY